jgi:hypothetical protein
MMITCDDAPALENVLHREFHKQRLNKANPRKEFFRADLDCVRKIVEADDGKERYKIRAVEFFEPDQLEYRQSIEMTDVDLEYIEQTFEAIVEDEDAVASEDA